MKAIWFHATNVFRKTEPLPRLLRERQERKEIKKKCTLTPLIVTYYEFSANYSRREEQETRREMMTERKEKKNK